MKTSPGGWWAQIPERERRWIVHAVVLLALACAALKANWRLEQLLDIDGTDETQYLIIGQRMPELGPPDPAHEIFFAPLYSTWYLALTQVQPDPFLLPGINYRILAVALAWVLFGILRRAGCGVLPAALVAGFLTINGALLDSGTRSVHFGVALLGLGVWLAFGARTRVRQCCWLAVGSTLAAFARPEYAMLAVGMLGVAGLLYGWKRFRQDRGDWRFLLGVAALMAALLALYGPPIGAGNDRSFLAFSQHFSLYYLRRHPGLEFNPWWDHAAIIQRAFGDAGSLSQALRANPGEFFTHVFGNLSGVLRDVFPILVSHRNFLLPEGHGWRVVENTFLVGGVGVLALAGWRRLGPNLRWCFQQAWPVAGFIIVASGLVVAGMVLTSPRLRHFFPLVFWLLVLLGVLLGREEAAKNVPGSATAPAPGAALGSASLARLVEARPLGLVALAIVLLGLTPASAYQEQRITSNRAVIAKLRTLSFQPGTGYIEAVGMERMEAYVPPLEFLHPTVKTEPFGAFVERHKVGAIHLTPYLKEQRQYAEDPEWHEFLRAPENYGFTPLPLPFHETLYVRKERLVPGTDGLARTGR